MLAVAVTDKLIPAWLQPVVVLDLLNARGADTLAALCGTALFADDIPFTHHFVNARQFDRLLSNADRQWRGGDFSFQLGHQLAAAGLGPLRDLVDETPDLTAQLGLISRFASLVTPSLDIRCYSVAPGDHFLLLSSVAGPLVSKQAIRCAVSLLSHWLRRSTSANALECFLRESTPNDLEQFQVHVAGRCHFAAPFNGLRLRTSAASGLATEPSLRARVAVKQCEQLCGDTVYLPSALQHLLWQANAHAVGLTECAQHLAISPATLKRRLQAFGYGFQELCDRARAERAVIDLLVKGASVEEVGAHLHFHDTSNFRRAFKRWTGMTPSRLKAVYRELFSASY